MKTKFDNKQFIEYSLISRLKPEIVKIKVLKSFISTYETDIIKAWTDYFILKKAVKKQIITKKL